MKLRIKRFSFLWVFVCIAGAVCAEPDAVFRISTSVIQSNPPLQGVNASRREIWNSQGWSETFEPVVDRRKIWATGYSNNTVSVDMIHGTIYNSVRSGYYDGYRARIYRWDTNAMNYALIRTDTVSVHRACTYNDLTESEIGVSGVASKQILRAANTDFVDVGRDTSAGFAQRRYWPLQHGTTYWYMVTAVDESGNESEPSVFYEFSVPHPEASITASTNAVVTNVYITTFTLPDAAVGTAYEEDLLYTGGTGTVIWSRTTGSLPPGISVTNENGDWILKGTPTSIDANGYTFTLQVSDGTHSATRELSMNLPNISGSSSDTNRPAPPTGLIATALNGMTYLSWSANSEPDLAGYRVYRSKASRTNGDHRAELVLAGSGPDLEPGDEIWLETFDRSFFDPECIADEKYNIVYNGSGVQARWNAMVKGVSDQVGGDINLSIDTNNPATGKGSLKIVCGSTNWARVYQYGFGAPNSFWYPLLTNHTYRMRLWIRQDGNIPSASADIYMANVYLNSTGSGLTNGKYTATGLTTNWQQVIYDFTTPAEYPTSIGNINIQFTGPGTLWIDQVDLFDPVSEVGYARPDALERLKGSAIGSIRTMGGAQYIAGSRSSLDNYICDWDDRAPDWDENYGVRNTTQDTLPVMLELAREVQADDFYVAGSKVWTLEEWDGFFDYLGGTNPANPYVAKRIDQRGTNTPWTAEFDTIFVSFENEQFWAGGDLTDSTSYARWAEYFYGHITNSSPVYQADPDKFTFILGGMVSQVSNMFSIAKSAEGYELNGYAGGHEEGDIGTVYTNFNDNGLRALLSGLYTDDFQKKDTDEAAEMIENLSEQTGRHLTLSSYETGANYSVPGLYNIPGSIVGEGEYWEAYTKSKAFAAVFMSYRLYRIKLGWISQNYFDFFDGDRWATHTYVPNGGAPQAHWAAAQIYNNTVRGPMLGVSALKLPATVFSPDTNDAQQDITVPMIDAYCQRNSNTYSIILFSRIVDTPGIDDGIRSVALEVPFTNVTSVTKWYLTGDPRTNNIGSLSDRTPAIVITNETLAVGDIFSNQMVTVSLAPAAMEVYIFEGTETPEPTGVGVTVNQAFDQDDPTINVPMRFSVSFSEPVSGFTTNNLVFGGDTSVETAVIKEVPFSGGLEYEVQAFPVESGTVTLDIPAGAVTGLVSSAVNTASGSYDNSIMLDSLPIAEFDFDQYGVVTTWLASAQSSKLAEARWATGPGLSLAGSHPDSMRAFDFNQSASLEDAVANEDYFSVTLTPVSGNGINLSQLKFFCFGSGSVNTSIWLWVQASTDGFESYADLGDFNGYVGTYGNPVDVFTPINYASPDETPVELRFYMTSDGSDNRVDFYAGDTEIDGLVDIQVTGRVSANPTFSAQVITSVGSVSVPEGSTNTFGVKLAAEPSSATTVTVSNASGDSDITVQNGASLVFTTNNWNNWQTVTLAAGEDGDSTGGSAVIRCSSPRLNSFNITATESDNDSPAILTSIGALNVAEGSTGTFNVELSAAPIGTVTVLVANISGDTDITVQSGASLVFDSGSWDTPKTVTLAAGEDMDLVDGSAIIQCSGAGLISTNVTATESDNDVLAMVTSTASVNVPEGLTATFNLKLSVQPVGETTVTVSRTSGDADITVTNGSSLVFTTNNWSSWQTVTLSASEDADITSDSAVITCASPGMTPLNVTATEVDNDGSGGGPLYEGLLALWNFQDVSTVVTNSPATVLAPSGITNVVLTHSDPSRLRATANAVGALDADSATLSAAITAGKYFTWTMDVEPGYELTITNITITTDSYSPVTNALFNSISGFADGDQLVLIGSGAQTVSADMNLDSITNQVEFRLYGFAGDAPTDRLIIGDAYSPSSTQDDVRIYGTISTVSSDSPDDVLNNLMLGAAMDYFYSDGGDGRAYFWTAENTAAYTNYVAWKSSHIQQLTTDWLTGTLSGDDQQYLPIIKADYLYQAERDSFYGYTDTTNCEAYLAGVQSNGWAALTKGYKGQTLTSNDLVAIRDFAIYDIIDITQTKILPFQLDLTRPAPSVYSKVFTPGETAPSFMVPMLSTVLDRAEYSDGIIQDPAAPLFPRSTNMYINLMNGYIASGTQPYEVTNVAYAVAPGESSSEYFNTTSAAGKPLVVGLERMQDGYWRQFCSRDMEPVYQAYKDAADFVVVASTYQDGTAAAEEYFGDLAGDDVCSVWPETQEELAADAKNALMGDPYLSIPTAVDTLGNNVRNAYAALCGDSHYEIHDGDGNLAYEGAYYFLNASAYDFAGGTAWANLMERELRKLLHNGGRYDGSNSADYDVWVYEDVKATQADRQTLTITSATVDSVNAISNIVVISKTIGGTNRQYTLHIGSNTRVSDGEEIADLSAFGIGDTVTVKFWADTYTNAVSTQADILTAPGELRIGNRVVRHEVTGDTGGDGVIINPRQINKGTTIWNLTKDMMWIQGRIESISGRQVEVALYADTNAMYGYKFWKQEGTNATLWGQAATSMTALDGIVADVVAGSNWTFVIDDDVDVFINGDNNTVDNLWVGAPVGLLYRIYQTGDAPVRPEVLRASENIAMADSTALVIGEGSSSNLTIKLAMPVVSNTTVTLSLLSGSDSDISISGSTTLVFTAANWSNEQTVAVQAAEDDGDSEDGTATLRIEGLGVEAIDIAITEADNDSSGGSDPAYEGLLAFWNFQDVTTVVTNSPATILAPTGMPSAVLTHSDPSRLRAANNAVAALDANSATLAAAIAAGKYFTWTMDVASGYELIITNVTITTESYSPVTNALFSSESGFTDGDQLVLISSGAQTVSTDMTLAGITNQVEFRLYGFAGDAATDRLTIGDAYNTSATQHDVRVYGTIRDVSNPELLVSTDAVQVAEGSTNTFQVRLTAQPQTDTTVTVSRTSGDTDITVSGGASLVFDSGNWSSWRTVTLSAAEDADTTDDSAVIQCSAAGMTSASVTVTESDNDTPLLAHWNFDNHAADLYDDDTQTSQDLNIVTNAGYALASATAAGNPTDLRDGWDDVMCQLSSTDDLSTTLTGSRYFTLSLAATEGQVMNLEQLVLRLSAAPSQITSGEVIDVAVLVGGTVIGSGQISDGNEDIIMTLDLSTNSVLQATSSVDFKIVGYNASSAFDRFAIGVYNITDGVDDIQVYGSISDAGASNPEITVQGNGAEIADGDMSPSAIDGSDFGDVNIAGVTATNTFEIVNDGTGDLVVTSVTLSGDGAFTLLDTISSVTLTNSESVTFRVAFDPSATVTYTATVSVVSSDSDESPYTFRIQGAGIEQTEEEALRFVSVGASFWSTGYANWVCPRWLFPYVAQWDGHPAPIEEGSYINDTGNYPQYDPRVASNRTTLISQIDASIPAGEELDFLLFQDQSEWTAISMVGSNGVQDHLDKAIGWGLVAQGVSTNAYVLMHTTWAYPQAHSVYDAGGAFVGRGPADMQAEVNDTYAQSVQAINNDVSAGTAKQTPIGNAWAEMNWTNSLYREWGSNEHASVRGDILATLVAYASVYGDDASGIYSRNSDMCKPDFSVPDTPALQNGANGTNDVIDLLTVVNADLEQAVDGSQEYLYPLTLADWHQLAHIADRVTFTGGDANTDGTVDSADLAVINANMGATNDVYWAQGDFDGDGDVDMDDLTILNTSRGLTLTVTPQSLDVPEGSNAVFTVKLAIQPEATVTVTVSRVSGDADITVQGGTSLVFTTGNWNTNQTVTLAAAQDADWDNDAAVIRCSAAGLSSVDVMATESDDDSGNAPDITVKGNSVSIADGDDTPSATDDTDFGAVVPGSAVTNTFQIVNDGGSALTLSNITLSGDAEFALLDALSDVTLGVSQSTNIRVKLDIPAESATELLLDSGFTGNGFSGQATYLDGGGVDSGWYGSGSGYYSYNTASDQVDYLNDPYSRGIGQLISAPGADATNCTLNVYYKISDTTLDALAKVHISIWGYDGSGDISGENMISLASTGWDPGSTPDVPGYTETAVVDEEHTLTGNEDYTVTPRTYTNLDLSAYEYVAVRVGLDSGGSGDAFDEGFITEISLAKINPTPTNGTYAATVTIVSDDPDESLFTFDLAGVTDGGGGRGMAVSSSEPLLIVDTPVLLETATLIKTVDAGSNLIGVNLEADSLADLLAGQLVAGDVITLYDAEAQQYVIVEDLSAVTVPAGGAFWLNTAEARDIVLTGTAVVSKQIVLLEGLQIIANPIAEDADLQSLGLSGTGNANPGLCDKVSVLVDGTYQIYGLHTDGIWYQADDKKVWSRKIEADELIEAGEGFWYDAQAPFIWTAE